MNENYETLRQLRRRLSRIGWGVLIYLVVLQILSIATALIPNMIAATLIGYTLSYGVGPLALWLVIRKLPKGACRNLPLSPRALVRTALVSLGVMEAFSIFTNYLVLFLEQVAHHTTTDILQEAITDMPTWLYLVLVGVFAPIGEEFLFRKLLLDRVRPFGDQAAIWITAVAFGLFHLNLYQFFYATALGVLFAGVVVKTGKLWHTIVLHSFVNLSTALFTELANWNDIGTIAVSIVLFGLMIYAVWTILRYRKSYFFDPPQYPATDRQVAQAAVRSVGLWVCFVLTLAASTAIIFYM